MAQSNKSHGSDFDNVVTVPIESEELGTAAQGYKSRAGTHGHRHPAPTYYYDNSDDSYCFADTTKVQLRDGGTCEMKDLKPGDKVQVVKPDGRLGYSPFIAMLHLEPDKKSSFLKIYVQGKKEPISLTPEHLIFATRNPQSDLGPAVYAKDVEKGLSVFSADQATGKVASAKVQKVLEGDMTGYCAPLTKEGTIMADGIAASCYAHFDHELAQKAFGPLRLLYGLKSVLGVGGKEKEVVKVGIHWYAKALMHGNRFLKVQPGVAI